MHAHCVEEVLAPRRRRIVQARRARSVANFCFVKTLSTRRTSRHPPVWPFVALAVGAIRRRGLLGEGVGRAGDARFCVVDLGFVRTTCAFDTDYSQNNNQVDIACIYSRRVFGCECKKQ